jgi:hypothetical protein
MARRGLLAVGLAVSVVGAIGVASILNAQADEVPGPSPAAPVAEHNPSPPPLLPWGDKPVPARVGKVGTGSDTLRVQGLDAAPAAGGPAAYRPRYAPKGKAGRGTFLKSEMTTTALPGANPPAADDGAVAPAPTTSAGGRKAIYTYNVGSMQTEADGFYASVSIAKPVLGRLDYHTLAELAVQSADLKQIVEVGWTVDRVVNNGDENPHLFVYHWVNGEKTCYNGCGFVPYEGATVKAGDILATGAKKFGIVHVNDAWWISYDSNFVGSFPDKLWQAEGVDTFTTAEMVQTFGEVASTVETPCSQMGNGLPGTDKAATVLGSVTLVNGPTAVLNIRSTTTTNYYTVNALSTRTFQYGGPGAGKDGNCPTPTPTPTPSTTS